MSPGAFTQLSLPLSMYIGGVPDYETVPIQIKVRTSFKGCIQKVCIKYINKLFKLPLNFRTIIVRIHNEMIMENVLIQRPKYDKSTNTVFTVL